MKKNRDGICPECKEWTTAGDSCCGFGAIVEGSLVSDETVQETEEEENEASNG